MFYNIVHNLGPIYDLTEEGIKLSLGWNDGVWKEVDYWKKMGFIAGSNFQNVLEDPKNYYKVDIDKLEKERS